MKLAAAPTIQRLGFKRALVGTSIVSALSIAMIALFGAGASMTLLSLALLAGDVEQRSLRPRRASTGKLLQCNTKP